MPVTSHRIIVLLHGLVISAAAHCKMAVRCAALQDAGKVLSEQTELAPLINSAVGQYEASGT